MRLFCKRNITSISKKVYKNHYVFYCKYGLYLLKICIHNPINDLPYIWDYRFEDIKTLTAYRKYDFKDVDDFFRVSVRKDGYIDETGSDLEKDILVAIDKCRSSELGLDALIGHNVGYRI